MSRTAHSTHRTGRAALAVATGIACALALAVAPASAAGSSERQRLPVLKGKVGPEFTISISDHRVPAGKYKLVVVDKGTIHNFHIHGDGVDKKTNVAGTGKTVWKLRFKAGEYHIMCDPHSSEMQTMLEVT
jgi:plastocyanin